MGVDFNCGSMSYQRYEKLILAIAKCFKGKPTIAVPKDMATSMYVFGFMTRDSNAEKAEKFEFEADAPDCIKKLCNNPYVDLNSDEVEELYWLLDSSKDNILVDSESDFCSINQFVYELKNCIDYGESWSVS